MELECRRCGRPVRSGAENYELFERMHYVCFHYEFEHDPVDVDEECSSGGCPSASLTAARVQVISTARELSVEAASGAPWPNAELHEYLEALAAWLSDANGFYVNSDRVPPGNGWEVMNDALRAATVYE